MNQRIEQDTAQWRLACEALLRERYATTGLDPEEYRLLEAKVSKILPPRQSVHNDDRQVTGLPAAVSSPYGA